MCDKLFLDDNRVKIFIRIFPKKFSGDEFFIEMNLLEKFLKVEMLRN